MIKKWDVAPAPNEKNPGRHKLRIKGEMKDIFLIVKNLGSLCSRPEKTSGDFDFIIYLSKLEMDTMKKLKSVAEELSSPAAVEADSFGDEPAPFDAPRPKLKTEPQPAPKAQPQQASAAPAEQPRPAPALGPAPAPAPAPAPQPAPAPAPEQRPAMSPAPQQPPLIPSARPSDMGLPSQTMRRKAEPVPAAASPAVSTPQPTISSRIKAKWSMELPLIPTYSFQTLIAGSHNRFAHAAAMAVVENPGVIYNPLLLFGAPGTGKTHFVNAISYGLSASIGQSNIFVTDGIKLSKGIELAIKENSISWLEDLLAKVKVLIIDDVHLLMVSDTNKKYLSKWLNDFVAQNKQIVVTSVFPPKSLSGLEDAVGFQFTQGWMVDLKMPNAQAYKSIISQLLQGLDIKLSEEEITNIFAAGLMPFGEAVKSLEDMRKLEKFLVNSSNNLTHSQLLDMLLGLSEAADPSPLSDDEARSASAWQPSGKDAWFKWGLFYPKGMRREAEFALYSVNQRAKELGLNTTWSQVFTEEYNSDELYGIPFHIGNVATERGINGAIVLGPQPTSALGAQEAEFRHITFKILDSFLVKGAWLPMGRLKSKSAYAKILMDLV
ncbi:MAG: DnaA/Hda family protein [Elusimicrobiales bacterium]|nr:DnaA/Hda family protein [Elusimicrobiales bacterium]